MDYDPMTSNSNKWTITDFRTVTYSSNGLYCTGANSWGNVAYKNLLSPPFVLKFDLTQGRQSSNRDIPSPSIIFSKNGTNYITSALRNVPKIVGTTIGGASATQTLTNVFGEYKYVVDSNSVKIYVDDELIQEEEYNSPNNMTFTIGTGTDRLFEFSNFKIKRLSQ